MLCICFCVHLCTGEWDVGCELDMQVQGWFLQILFDKEPYYWYKKDSKVMAAILKGEAPWGWGATPLELILGYCCHQSSSGRPPISDVVTIMSAHPLN